MSNGTKLVKYILIMVNFNVFVGITNYIKHTAIAIFLTLFQKNGNGTSGRKMPIAVCVRCGPLGAMSLQVNGG